ncbi:hypothetical protein GOODEAATRI_009681 [Goodea atripinnis]|uniref:Uncharacterized protein n=1 Tax=Goodea atripinnis TaxID=208336 RepID=A0ABV0P345_9TELE
MAGARDKYRSKNCVDSCRRGLWARRCGSLGLLHCRCWVVPLGLSTALLWGGCGSPGGGSPGVPVLWGAFGCLWLGSPLCPPREHGAGRWVLKLPIAYFCGETLYTNRVHTHTHRC